MTIKWTDTTSRSRGEPHDAEARVWTHVLETKRTTSRITVHRHIYSPGRWFLSTSGDLAFFDNHLLDEVDVEEAKKTAIYMIRDRLSEMHEAIDDVVDVLHMKPRPKRRK